MGQQEVLNILNQKKEFLTAHEIAELSNTGYNCVIRALKMMMKFEEVERKVIKEKHYNMRKIYVWKVILK